MKKSQRPAERPTFTRTTCLASTCSNISASYAEMKSKTITNFPKKTKKTNANHAIQSRKTAGFICQWRCTIAKDEQGETKSIEMRAETMPFHFPNGKQDTHWIAPNHSADNNESTFSNFIPAVMRARAAISYFWPFFFLHFLTSHFNLCASPSVAPHFYRGGNHLQTMVTSLWWILGTGSQSLLSQHVLLT